MTERPPSEDPRPPVQPILDQGTDGQAPGVQVLRKSPSGIGLLGALMVGACLVDLIVGRLLLSVLPVASQSSGVINEAASLRAALETPARMAHGFVAALALALCVHATGKTVWDPSFAPAPRRMTLLVLSIFALPILGLAFFVRLEPRSVFVALTAVSFIGVVCAINGLWKPIRPMAKLFGCLCVTPLVLGTVDALGRSVPWMHRSFLVTALPSAAKVASEICVVLVGLLAPFALIETPSRRTLNAPMAAAILVALAPTVGFGVLAAFSWSVTRGLALRALGLSLLIPYGQTAYLAALFGFALTVAYHLWPRPHQGVHPEIGLGLAALCFGGLGTYSPFRLLLMLVGFLLLATGVQRSREA